MATFWERVTQGSPRPAQQQAPSRYSPSVLPQGMGQNPQQAVSDYLSRQPGYQPPQQYQPPTPALDPSGQIDMSNAVRLWRGNSNGGASETQLCPNCGSDRYFSRNRDAEGRPIRRMTQSGQWIEPHPECFVCGYPQSSGTYNREAAAAKPQGAVAIARQSNYGRPDETSMNVLRGQLAQTGHAVPAAFDLHRG